MRQRIALVWFPPAPPPDLGRIDAVHARLCGATDALTAHIAPTLRLPQRVLAYNSGMGWLSRYAENIGLDVEVVTPSQLQPEQYDAVGLSVTCPDVPDALSVAAQTRRSNPGAVLLAGGPHFHSVSDEELLEWFRAGFAVIDKGAGLDALDAVNTGLSLSQRIGRQALNTPWARLFRDVIGPDYSATGLAVESTIPNVCTSVGCGLACAFCAGARSRWVPRGLTDVEAELHQLADVLPCGHMVHFTDCDLAANPARLHDLFPRLPDTLVYSCDAHLRSVERDLMHSMWSAGFVRFNVGIEDTSVERSSLTMADIPHGHRAALARLRDAFPGVIRGYFMVGLPHATRTSMDSHLEELAHLLKHRLIDIATVKTLVPYPGTRLGDHPETAGMRIVEHDLRHYRRLGYPVYETEELSRQDIDDWLVSALGVVDQSYCERLVELGAGGERGTCNYFGTLVSESTTNPSAVESANPKISL